MTGRRGPIGKPVERRAGHRAKPPAATAKTKTPKTEAVVPAVEIPAAPGGLSEIVLEAWLNYWLSDVARVASKVDLPAIRRLFRMYDQYDKALDVVDKAIVVKGSTGQIRVNPLADYAFKLAGAILRLEEELGLTPLSRQRLGIAVAERFKSLDELNQALSEQGDDEDPRLG